VNVTRQSQLQHICAAYGFLLQNWQAGWFETHFIKGLTNLMP